MQLIILLQHITVTLCMVNMLHMIRYVDVIHNSGHRRDRVFRDRVHALDAHNDVYLDGDIDSNEPL